MTIDADVRPESAGAETLQIARRVRSQFRFSFDDQDQNLVRLPSGNITRLVQQIAPTVRKSVRQIVTLADRGQVTESFPNAVWQSLADDPVLPVQVQRLYLLAPGDLMPEPERVSGQFQVKNATVRDFIDAQPTSLPVRNSWLIDEIVVISEEPDSPGYWQVSTRPVDAQRFKIVWGKLWNRERNDTGELDTLSEPLAQSADMMATIAKMSCSKHLYAGGTCAWYHSIWQYLRLFDLVSSPAWHADFFSKALDEALSRLAEAATPDRHPRVLITGTADYSMLAYVLRSAERTGVALDVTVMDQCRTPLIACQWYARLRDILPNAAPSASRVDIWERDIFEFLDEKAGPEGEAQFDVIATDAFLTRFKPKKAAQITRIWNRLLALGGSLITTTRIHPLDNPRGGILDEVSSFAMRARDRATRWGPYLQVRLDDLTAGARQYAMQIRS
jgi:hypothetical protein